MRTRTEDLRGQDVIDSRDVIARFEELDAYRDEAIAEVDTARANEEELNVWKDKDDTEYAITPDWDEETRDEWKALNDLISEAECSPDWSYGEGLIKDSYFKQYAEQLADDLGYWPYDCIDWEKAADQLKQDYMSVTFDGTEYWIRA